MNPFNLNILIVEDELSFAIELEMLLDELNYNILARVDNSAEALDLIFSQNPDLILMDVDIKGNLSGVEIGQKIKHLDIPILYITSMKDEETLQAAKASNLIGYLVKPIEKITLQSSIQLAIEKAYYLKNRNQKADTESESVENFVSKECFFFKKSGIYHKVPLSDIAIIKSDGNYCETTDVNNQKFISRITINKFESLLPPEHFIRTHRQYIVQISQIESIDFNDGILTVRQTVVVPVSRNKRKELEAVIRKMD